MPEREPISSLIPDERPAVTAGLTPRMEDDERPLLQSEPAEDVQFPVEVDRDSGSLNENFDRVEASPDFFDDISRASQVGLTREIVDNGIDNLTGVNDSQGIPLGLQVRMAARSGARLSPFGEEALGLAEIGLKMLLSMAGTGYSSIASAISAAVPVRGGDSTDLLTPELQQRLSENQIDSLREAPTAFVDEYISTQGKLAASFGRFFDYAPLFETTERNVEAVGGFFESTVGAAGEWLGDKTYEITGSPVLAALAKTSPDLLLLTLPFAPKAVRSIRNSRQLIKFEAELAATTQTAASKFDLTLQRIDSVSLPDGTVLPGQTINVVNPEGITLGSIRAFDRGGDTLQVTSVGLDDLFQGKGIGVDLYNSLVQTAVGRGYSALASDTVVSASAANVWEALGRRGYRVEKNPTAEFVDVDDVRFQNHWESGNGQPVYRVVLDEPLETSSLTTTRMNVETLQALSGEAARLEPAAIAQMADDLRSGKTSGEIIVETVNGMPVGIVSGAENVVAIPAVAEQAGLRVRSLTVRLQERQAHTPEQMTDLRSQARAGMDDILENERKLEAYEAGENRTIWERIKHLTVDTSANVKAEIIRALGALGEIAIRDFTLKAGALPYAHLRFRDFHRAVYGDRGLNDPGLGFRKTIPHLEQSLSEIDLFNILVQSRRTAAIVQSGGATSRAGRFQLEGAVKPENAAGNIFAIRETLGESRFAQLNARADHVFRTMHDQLVRLRDNGVITQAQFLRLQNIDYITREFLEAVDPLMLPMEGVKISIGESGIYHLRGGSRKAQNIDVQSLVAEYLARTEGRIARNNANRSLYLATQAMPDNGFVRLATSDSQKTPQGFSELRVMVDGEPQRMFMRSLYASEWVINDPGMNLALANVFRILNGTFIVKPLATGINPAFAIVNFPRDIHHAWKATGTQYSSYLPVYLGQIFSDIVKVSRDVWSKQGRYRDFIEEGGGMNFLTHGGFDPLVGLSTANDAVRAVGVSKGVLGRALTRIKEELSRVNEFSELSVRLAIRERVIQNQLRRGEPIDTQTATYIARNYLDFSQGGSITKAMESIIPYTNAASQAIRTAIRPYTQGVREAATAALKDLQILSLKAVISQWSWSENPEAMAQVDAHQAYSNVIFPTGLHYTDEQGNRRHLTVQVAMDTTVLPFTAPFDRMIAKYNLLQTGVDPDDVPSGHVLSEIMKSIPIIGSLGLGSPVLQAGVAMLGNKDLWNNRDIWTGNEFVSPGFERDERTEGTIFNELGSIAPETISPVRLQKAWRTLVPSNFYIDSADFIRQMVQNATDPVVEQQRIDQGVEEFTLELLDRIPGLNRLLHVTHPAAQTTPELRLLARDVANWHEIERQGVQEAVRQFTVLDNVEPFQRILDRVVSVRPMDAERVQELFISQVVVEEMYKNNDYDIGFVGEDWFTTLAGQPPEVKAELYYNKYISLSDENVNNLNAVIAQVDKVGGRRIRTDEFENHLKLIISRRGTRSERIRAVMDGN